MTPSSGCLLLTRRDAIMTFDLTSRRVQNVPFDFLYQSTEQSEVYPFSESGLICVREHGYFGQSVQKLTYFLFPSLEEPVFAH